MRVLLISTPVTTHLSPMFPVAWALKAAGHEVLAAGHPDVVQAARGAGLSTWTVGDNFHIREQMAGHLVSGKRPIELGAYRDVQGSWDTLNKVWVDNARYMVRRYLALAQAWQPDLIITDPLEFSGRMIGGLLSVPVVLHRWGVDLFGEQAQDLARRALVSTLSDLGLTSLPEPALVLDPCPPSLQLDGVPQGLAIRCVPANGSGPLPAWALGTPPRRRVCLTFGRITAGLNGLPLFHRVLKAIGQMPDVEGVLTLEREFHEVFGPAPANVRVVEPVPLDLFLGTCDAIVHHGGSSTCMSAVAFGVPQLVLPGFGDSFAVGDQVAASGAGRTIARIVGQSNPEAIRKAVAALLDDPAHRKAAQRLADEVSGLPTPNEVVARLEELARRG